MTGSPHAWRLGALLHPHESDFRGRGWWPAPTFPHMDQFANSRHVAQRSWRADYQSCGTCLQASNPILWMVITQGRTSLRIQFDGSDPSWATRAAQAEVPISTVQEGCCANLEAVVEKRTKARGPGCPHRMTKIMKTPATSYDIEEWMQGVEGDTPQKDTRKNDAARYRSEWLNAHSQQASWGSR